TAGTSGPPSSYTGDPYVVPIGIIKPDYDKYKFTGDFYSPTEGHAFVLIRHNKQALGEDDLALFDLRQSNGKSPKKMQEQLTGADRPLVTIYDRPYPDYDRGSCTTTSCHQSLN